MSAPPQYNGYPQYPPPPHPNYPQQPEYAGYNPGMQQPQLQYAPQSYPGYPPPQPQLRGTGKVLQAQEEAAVVCLQCLPVVALVASQGAAINVFKTLKYFSN
uniref:Rhodopsin n=1 Tax=Meloidogyne hapla TaxID=6305 RepID=A0A1I8BX97_MELHA